MLTAPSNDGAGRVMQLTGDPDPAILIRIWSVFPAPHFLPSPPPGSSSLPNLDDAVPKEGSRDPNRHRITDMASAPQGPEDERGSTGNDARSAADEGMRAPGTFASGESSGPGLAAPGSAAAADAAEEIALYEEEASLETLVDLKRTARLLFEAAHLRERQLGQVRDARKTYTQSLTTDPTLQATTWALFGLFGGRGAWENLVRLLDAEIRFAPLPTPADRADILVEKGRVLEDRLGRDDDARTAYRAALEMDPAHPAALMALLTAALRGGGDPADAEKALGSLSAYVVEPQMRALFAVELVSAERGPFTAETPAADVTEKVRHSIDTLLRVSLPPSAEEPIAAELYRLSQLVDDPDLRTRVLDFLDSRINRSESPLRLETSFLVALYREKARLLLRRGAHEAALAVLERGVRVAPDHPLLIADLFDAAERAGETDAIAPLLDDQRTPLTPAKRDEALLRRAEAAARAGALGEAMGNLDRVARSSKHAALVTLARIRVVARSGDAEGLARLFTAEAERLVAPREGFRVNGVAADSESAREAAHLLVRAGIIHHQILKNPRAAREPALRALSLVPDYAPARDVLRGVFAELREWAALAQVLEADAAATASESRRQELHKVLLVLHRDVLREPAARFETPASAAPDEAVAAARAADQAGDRYVSTADAPEEVIRQLRALSERIERDDGPAAAGLRLLASRLAWDAGAERSALALAEEAFRCAPGPAETAELERQYRTAGRPADRLSVLAGELAAAEQAGPATETARALRFRIAFSAAEAGRYPEALEALRSLREQKDRSAVLWSWEIARNSGAPTLEGSLLAEPAVESVFAEVGPESAVLRLLALGEARERAGLSAAAADPYRAALEAAPPGPLALEAALGLLRVVPADAGELALAQSFDRLAAAAANTAIAGELARESELLSLALAARGAPGGGSSSDGPLDAIRMWVRGVHAEDPRARLEGLERMARAKSAPAAAAELWAALGVRRLLGGDRVTAWSALARAAEGPTAPLVELAASDLAGDMPFPGRIAHARRSRAERLGEHEGAGTALAEILMLEEGAQEERLAHWHAAASAYAAALEHQPGSLEALEGLRRVSFAIQSRRGQAAAQLRIAALLQLPARAAERCALAGMLFEEEGSESEAANAYLEVLRQVPEHEEGYRRLRRILLRREQPAALESLLSFKIAHTADTEAKIRLLTERAALRLGPLQKRREAIHDHRRILALDPDRVASLRLLARLAMGEERFGLAVEYLTRAQGRPGVRPEEAAAMQLDLAAAYEADKQPQEAERVLRAALETKPDDPVVRERLVALALRSRRFDLAAEQLRVLQALTEGRAAKAAVAVRLAKLEREERRNVPAALAALRSALQLDPLGEVIPELAATIGDSPLSPEDAAAINGVLADLRRDLEKDPLQLRPLECLRDLAGLRGLTDLYATAAQLLTALGAGAARGRARDLQRPVALAALGAAGAPGDRTSIALMREVWPQICTGVARLYGPPPTEIGISKQTRLPPGSDPRLAWAEAAGAALGISSLAIHIPPLDDLFVAGVDLPESALALGRGVLGGDAVSRFRVGRVLALLRDCATALERIAVGELELIWSAAVYLGHPRWFDRTRPQFDEATLKTAAKRLAKGMSRREIKNLESYALGFEQAPLDVAGWRESVLRSANRFGLLVSGDLAAALRALTQRSSPSRQDLLAAPCQDLIQFAFSDRFAAVRREAGLSRD
jgi:tetratricopeptide (TPR) repeat protein